MLFVNYTIDADKDKVLSNIEDNDRVVAEEAYDTSKGKPKMHIKSKGKLLKIKCEMTELPTKDNAFLEGTYFIGTLTQKKNTTALRGVILTAPIYHAVSSTGFGVGTGQYYGHVKLSDATNLDTGNTGGIAATPKAVKAAYDNSELKAPIDHATDDTTYGAGSGSNYGHVKLSDATNSTSSTSGGIAATPAAVKAAYDLANGRQQKNVYFTNVAASGFVSDATYSDFPYRCAVSLTGVTSSMFAEVIFSAADAMSGNYSPVCETYAGGVYIYAKTNTAITIPTIAVFK